MTKHGQLEQLPRKEGDAKACGGIREREYYDEARFPHCPTCKGKLSFGWIEYRENSDICLLCGQRLQKETCGSCKNCTPIENVAGADCKCEARSENDSEFEVSQTDYISFYGMSKSCEYFVVR